MRMHNIISKIYFLFVVVLISTIIQATSPITPEQQALLDSLPPDQREGIMGKMVQAQAIQDELEETFEKESSLIVKPEIDQDKLKRLDEDACMDCIYGYDFFQYSPSSFAPMTDSPVSSDYILGPGDKLRINYYGNDESEEETFISREGFIVLPMLGRLNLMGMSFKDASEYIKNQASLKLIGIEVSVSLSELRSISIFVLGEAYKPGKYTMSGLSNISNALFISGGVNEDGSLRNIQVKRNNKVVSTYDFYDFLLNGSTKTDINLQDGDVIFIPFIENTVRLGGAFKRPHLYEFKEGETVKDAINLAGGVISEVLPGASVELNSIDKATYKRKLTYLRLGSEQLKLKLQNSDVINVSSKTNILSKTIKLTGEFVNPGEYSVLQGDSILDIIDRAGGYTKDGFAEGAIYLRKDVAKQQKEGFYRTADELENTMIDIITNLAGEANISEFTLVPISRLITKLRTEEPLGRFVVDVDYLSLKTDPLKNFKVRGGDTLHIPTRPNTVSIVGEVLNASTQTYVPEFRAQDYINSSGGLNDSADNGRIFIISPSGRSSVVGYSFFSSRNTILPGSTIVIPRDPRPLDAVGLTRIITPVLADLATSAAAIAAISD